MRAMSLNVSEGDTETNETRILNAKLDRTQTLIENLVAQLAELKEEVSGQEPRVHPSCRPFSIAVLNGTYSLRSEITMKDVNLY